ncbi:unnamed protein product [Urochloa humidicola]
MELQNHLHEHANSTESKSCSDSQIKHAMSTMKHSVHGSVYIHHNHHQIIRSILLGVLHSKLNPYSCKILNTPNQPYLIITKPSAESLRLTTMPDSNKKNSTNPSTPFASNIPTTNMRYSFLHKN